MNVDTNNKRVAVVMGASSGIGTRHAVAVQSGWKINKL